MLQAAVENRVRQRTGLMSISDILDRLATASSRPRYAYMVLGLIAESADRNGKAGPLVATPTGPLPLRDWIAEALLKTAERDRRRAKLRAGVARELAQKLPPGEPLDLMMLEAAVTERARQVGRANVSRAVSDLVRAGLVQRHYEGYRTNHHNRGGGRSVVYTVSADVLAALRRGTQLL